MLTPTSLSKLVPAVLLALTLSSCTHRKTGYVDIFKLVNEFELQKEYARTAQHEIDRRRASIDSVVFVEKLKDPAASERIKKELYNALYQKTEQTNKEIETMTWKRLNPYLEEFGREKGYEYIYGANGTGNVLYADTTNNLTEEVIKYVNDRYHDAK